jgi:hypothetical protein
VAITSDSIGLLFRAKGDTDDAKKAFSDLRTNITGDVDAIESKGKTGFSGLAQSMGLSEGAAVGLAAGVAVAAAAIVAAVSAAISLSVGLFNLTKSASEYGSEIKDASDKTGLSASTLTTLKYAADNAGSSLETVTSGTAKFAKLIGEASDGNVKAQKTLKELGVTSKDLNTALSEVTKTIFDAKDGTEQIVIAQKAFGKSGADLIPVIKQFGGDLAAAQKEAERLGITLTEKDIKASDDFGDALGLLGAQAKTASVAFTSDLMPVLTKFFTLSSEWYGRNQDEVRLWGFAIARTLEYTVDIFSKAFKTISDHAEGLRIYLAGITFGLSELAIAAAKITREGFKRQYDAQESHGEAGGSATGSSFVPGGSKGAGKARSGKSDAEKQAEADLKAQLDLQKLALKQLEDEYKETLKHIREEFKKTGDDNALVKAADAALTKFREATQVANDLLNDLERQAAGSQTDNQEKLTTQQQMERVRALNAFITDEVDKTNKLIVDANQKKANELLQIEQKLANNLKAVQLTVSDNAVKTAEESWDKQINDLQGFNDEQNRMRGEAYNDLVILFTAQRDGRLQDLDIEYQAEKAKIEKEVTDKTAQLDLLQKLDELYKGKALLTQEEFEKKKQEIEDKYAIPVTPGEEKGGTGFLSGVINGLGTSIDDMLKKVEPLKGIGNIIGSQFQLIAQGVGNAVKAFVLFGTAGGSFRKFAAEIIASVAQMAIVQAVWELAQGFAMLALTYFTGNPKYAAAAGAHFTAAAIYGIVGGAAAIAGRFTAGDKFKQESAGAYGTAGGGTGSQSNSGQGKSNNGGVYSSQEDQIVEVGRNAPGGLRTEVVLTVKDKSDWFAQMFKVEMGKNGLVRQLVQDANT